MASGVSRDSYFETGLDVLSDLGYGGLKLAEVCQRLGVTTGSFYHYFTNWAAYTRELIEYWVRERTLLVIEAAYSETDPRRRIDKLIQAGLGLPHGAEAAIRVWSSLDPHVHSVQVAVDRQRFDIMYESACEILPSKRQAEVFASWAVYLLVGYEQSALPPDAEALEWIARRLQTALETDGFASVPDGG